MLISEIKYKPVSEILLDVQRELPESLIKAINACMFSYEADSREKADCILVLGSKNGLKSRVPRAASLFKAGRAPLVLAAGGAMTESGKTEAELYFKGLVESGVDCEAVMLENFSSNTPENMMFSKKALEEKFGFQPLKLIIVTNSIHMKRALLTAKQYFPSSYSFIPSVVPDSSGGEAEWFLNENGRKKIEKELRSLVVSVVNDWAADESIETQPKDFSVPLTI